jgi:hypothetical protein
MGLGLFFMGIQSTVRMREKYKFRALSAKHISGGLGYNERDTLPKILKP